MAEKKAVVKTEKNIPVSADIFDGVAMGDEGLTAESFKVPFLKILEAISPEVQDGLIAGAQAGKFLDPYNNEVKDTMRLIVLKARHDLVVWKPNRGGFVGSFSKTDEAQIVASDRGVYPKLDKDGNEVHDTITFYVMDADRLEDGTSAVMLFPISGGRFKHARSFNNQLTMLKLNGKRVPFCAGVWEIGLVKEKKDSYIWHSIGNTPKFKRWVTKKEMEEAIKPSLGLIEKIDIDYNTAPKEEIAGEETPF